MLQLQQSICFYGLGHELHIGTIAVWGIVSISNVKVDLCRRLGSALVLADLLS